MKRPSREDLLGYVLGALETRERQQVEQFIRQDSETQETLCEIKDQLAPLDYLQSPAVPPAGLAQRTCRWLDAALDAPSADPALAASPPRKAELRSRPRSWKPVDALTVAAVLLILSAIVLPAVYRSRMESRLLACQNNLRQIGQGLQLYSTAHGGRYPEIPQQGNSAVAGRYAPVLLEGGLVEDEATFRCAGRTGQVVHPLPTLQQMDQASGAQLRQMQQWIGGDFAYSLGYLGDDGAYHATEYQGRPWLAIMADAPSFDNPGMASSNHGGTGQNCLFDDGHIRFVKTCSIGGDSIFLNVQGVVAAGLHSDDAVVAPSAARPLLK